MTQKNRATLLLGAPIFLAIVVSLILQYTILTRPDEFSSWLSQFGPWVILIYVLLQALTLIIAPIGGFFLQVAMLALFPAHIALLIIYLTATPVYLINFYLARKYGRPLVQKIVGHKALEKIDELAADAGTSTLVILKVFNSSIFDYISYAVGLTKIPFKTFLIVNVFCGIPSLLLSYFMFTRFNNLTLGVIALYLTAYTLGGISIYLNHMVKKHQKKKLHQ